MYKVLGILAVLLIIVWVFYIKWEYICANLVLPDIMEWKSPCYETPVLYGNKKAVQYFAPNFNGLFRIGFRIKYKKASEANIEVAVGEKGNDRKLFMESIPLGKIKNNGIFRFNFPPQRDSAGKAYYLNISAPLTEPQTDLRLFFDPGPFFHTRVGGKLYFDSQELPGELSMVSECRVDVKKGGFIKRWHDFVDDKNFVIFYVSVTAACLISLFLFMLL